MRLVKITLLIFKSLRFRKAQIFLEILLTTLQSPVCCHHVCGTFGTYFAYQGD